MRSAVALGLAYLVGSVPFSYLIARRWGVDVRRVGSGNVGATNVMRTAGRLPGLVAFVLDFLKGTAAVVLAIRLEPGGALPPLAAASAILGHMFPVWLGFRGGKGAATGAGAFLPLAPWATGAAVVVFALTLALSRYVSLGSMAGAASLAALAFLLGLPRPVAWSAAGVAVLVVWKHRGNIERIARGTESRLGAPRP